jgi:hypothetical protein
MTLQSEWTPAVLINSSTLIAFAFSVRKSQEESNSSWKGSMRTGKMMWYKVQVRVHLSGSRSMQKWSSSAGVSANSSASSALRDGHERLIGQAYPLRRKTVARTLAALPRQPGQGSSATSAPAARSTTGKRTSRAQEQKHDQCQFHQTSGSQQAINSFWITCMLSNVQVYRTLTQLDAQD